MGGQIFSDCDGDITGVGLFFEMELDLEGPVDERRDLRDALGEENRLSLGLVVWS